MHHAISNEPRHEQTVFFACAKIKAQISFAVTASPVCVGPGRNPNSWFSYAHAQIQDVMQEL